MIKRIFNSEIPHSRLRLHSSEKTSPWNIIFPKFKEAIKDEDIRYYPNIKTSKAYSLLQDFYLSDNFLIGAGSDRCIKYFFELYQNKSKVVTTDPNFPMYNVYADMYTMEKKLVPYTELKFPTEQLINNIDDNSIVVISNPSSPIGDLIDIVDIHKILIIGVPVLIDEAYIEFANATSVISLIKTYPNLFVTRTFSKALGSAGIRVGTIHSKHENIKLLLQYRDMYEITGLSLKWIETLLDNYLYVQEYIDRVKKTKTFLLDKFKNNNIQHISSESNWIHIKGDLNIPENIEVRKDCKVLDLGDDWIRLCVSENIEDYNWL